MWTGYIRIKKATDITAGDIAALKLMGSAQVSNYPNLRTHLQVSLNNRQAIIELESTIEPIESDVPFGVTEFQIFAGACWCDKCVTCNTYIKDNIEDWEE